MAQFPQLNLQGAASPDVYDGGGAAGAGADALSSLGGEADHLGRTLNDMAERAAKVEGEGQAAADVAAGQVVPRNNGTVKGDSYDAVAKNFLSASRQAQMHEALAAAYTAHPDSPTDLAPALQAAYDGLQTKATGFPDVDTALQGHFLVQRADYMARAVAGARAKLIETDKAGFTTDLDNAQQLLDQVAAGAPSDDQGGARITGAGQLFVQSLAKYGPKTAFDIGGVHFDADPTRREAIGADDIARVTVKALSQARKTWILQTAQGLSDEGSRKMFARQVEEKWKAGDPAFAGLDGQDMDQLQAKLEASADRARADDRAAKSEYAKQANDAIEAFGYGQDVNFDEALTNAKLSGDQGLVAKVEFYKNADPATRGVLKTVVARSLGLLGQSGPPAVVVDAQGQPVDGGNAEAVAAQITPDPAGFFSKMLGGKKVEITSAERTAAHNAAVHGSPTSEHIPGNGHAWDIVVPGQSSAETFAQLRAAGVPHDQIIDEHDHVHVGIGPQMRGQAFVKGGAWATPSTVAPGTPAYVAWASAREGFSTDPLTYALGGANRAAIANVPVLVPDSAFQPGAPAQAWATAYRQRFALGQVMASQYGVPARSLTNGERDHYKAAIDADPFKGIALAGMARNAAGPEAAMRLMRELGETDYEASASLHIADLAAGGAVNFAKAAAQGMQLQASGKYHLEETDRKDLTTAFDGARGSAPPPVLTAAFAVAGNAMVADRLNGGTKTAEFYVNSALGMQATGGRLFGGPANVNGGKTVLPRWLAQDHAVDALQRLGDSWSKQGIGPVWSDGSPVDGEKLRHMQMVLQASGAYRFVNPRTGNPLMARSGRAFEVDLDPARPFLAQALGAQAVRPGG